MFKGKEFQFEWQFKWQIAWQILKSDSKVSIEEVNIFNLSLLRHFK